MYCFTPATKLPLPPSFSHIYMPRVPLLDQHVIKIVHHAQLPHHPFSNLVLQLQDANNSHIWKFSAPEGMGHDSNKPIELLSA